MEKNKIQTLIAIIVLLVFVVAGTYAYFAPQAGGTTSTNATVTSNTTDLLTFSINRDISFTVTQNDFQENGTNQSGDATATATLTPNNKTGAATMNYYLYLNIEENPITYSEANTNGLPELMLQVFDGNNQLVTLTGLGEQVTVKGVTGYDITAIEGLQTLLDNHAISASNNTATIENWRIVITLINHDFNQNDNTGKEVEAEIIIRQTPEITYEYVIDYSGESIYEAHSTREELAQAYQYWNESSIYIKKAKAGEDVINQEICLWYNNHDFCFGTDYLDMEPSAAETKLRLEMEDELATSSDSCSSSQSDATCFFGIYGCGVDYFSSRISCGEGINGRECYVYDDGFSYCYTN